MRATGIFVLFVLSILPFGAGATGVFEGAWFNEDPTGDGVASVSISRYGDTFVGEIQAGSRRGRLWFSKIKGWIENEKLFTRICDEGDDDSNSDEMNKCLEQGPISNYFVMSGKNLVWFRKESSGWRELVVLHPAKRAVKAPKE